VILDKNMSKNESTKRKSKDKESRIKHQTCYTYCGKCHLSKDYPRTQTFIHTVVNNISHVEPKNDTNTIKMISSPSDSSRAIWVPKHLLTNHEGPNKAWVPKQGLSINKKVESFLFFKHMYHYANINPMQSQEQDKCLSL
jgi:hypothetical protein